MSIFAFGSSLFMREAKVHELKTWPPYFQEVYQGRKNFEVRLNDRGFQPMDILRLKEFRPDVYETERAKFLAQGVTRDHASEEAAKAAYTGRSCERMIGYILHGGDPAVVGMEAAHSGIQPGYVVLSLVSTPNDMAEKRAAWEASRPPRPPLVDVRGPRS
jgi:hypothetical protein